MTSLAAIHTGKKALGLDDDTYRAMLARITGKQSARDLTVIECRRVIDEMRRQGFKPCSGGIRKPLEGRFAKKLQALWRQTGIDHVRFVRDADDASKAIEALKSWLTRAGGVDWQNFAGMEDYQQAAGYRIAMAQWCSLHRNNAARLKRFEQEISAISGKPVQMMTNNADWVGVMNMLGREIRREKGAALQRKLPCHTRVGG